MPIPVYVTLLRLIIPLFIFKWPLWGTLASAIMDLNDWKLINFIGPQDYVFYQNWDKALDLYYLTFAVIMTYKWRDKVAQKLAVGLFFYRLTGDILFWTTQNRIFLFIFPNFFESFFLFYLLFVFICKKTQLFVSKKVWFLIFIFVGIPKLINEYFLHVIQVQPWQVYNLGEKLGFFGAIQESINLFAQALIFYILPFIIGLYWVKKK